jgi:hypothetical protein
MGSMTMLERVLALPAVPYADRRHRLPDRPGLYFVIRDGQEVMYIGMSRRSILRRWKTWHQVVYDVENSGITDRTRIAYIVYSDADRVVKDEKAAIREFRPPFNYSHVPGAYERDYRRRAEECPYINCHDHFHETIPQREPPTACDCHTPECVIYPGLKPPPHAGG